MLPLEPDMIEDIAATHGFEPDDYVVIESVRQANEVAATGYRDAITLLDCYLAQAAYEAHCETQAARDFEYQAYGRD